MGGVLNLPQCLLTLMELLMTAPLEKISISYLQDFLYQEWLLAIKKLVDLLESQ